ncbi:MAG: flagellin [Verrucomicrobiota bacterium]
MIISNANLPQSSAEALQLRAAGLRKSLAQLGAASAQSSKGTAAIDDSAASDSVRRHERHQELDSAESNISAAMSLTQTQQSYLGDVSKALQRMGELATEAQSPTTSDAQRAQFQAEYSQLGSSITNVSTKNFNGLNLFTGATLQVSVGSDGSTLSLPGVDLGADAYTAAVDGDLGSAESAQSASDRIQTALGQVSADAATLAGNDSQLKAMADQLAVGRQNLHAAGSAIHSAAAAEQSMNFASESILKRSEAAMLAQANAQPEAALRLLP